MDQQQEGNSRSTASFGSSDNMTSAETTNVAMVGQTVAGDVTSSMDESPAPSSESALEMYTQRANGGGLGQSRSAEQNLPAPTVLPTMQDQGGEPAGFGLSQSMMPQSAPELREGNKSQFVTPRRSREGSITSTMGRGDKGTGVPTVFGKAASSKSSPRGAMEQRKLSGRSTPADSLGQNSFPNPLIGAEALLTKLINDQCASPGATSQGSQRALPEGEPMEVDEKARLSFPHSYSPPPLPDGMPALSPIPFRTAEVLSADAAKVMVEMFSTTADVVMGQSAKLSRAGTPHKSLMVHGPPSPRAAEYEKTSSAWADRNTTKRQLDDTGDDHRDKKAASSSSGIPIFQSPTSGDQKIAEGNQRIADAQYFVRSISRANSELGEKLAEENAAAQMAAQNYLQKSHASSEQREMDLQYFRQATEGLARSYQNQTDENVQQVVQDQDRRTKAHQQLQEELGCYHRQHLQDESQMQRMYESVNQWKAESEQEGRIAARFEEHAQGAAQKCAVAENSLRQYSEKEPQSNADLRRTIHNIEHEAMAYVQDLKQKSEMQVDRSEKQAKLMHEEAYTKSIGLRLATQRGDRAEAECEKNVRLLAQEKSILDQLKLESSARGTFATKTHEDYVQAQKNYVEALRLVDDLKT
jgi:hypothetical protein